jgi:hypothetical protein
MIDVLYWKSVKWATRKNILLVTLLKKGVGVNTDVSYCMVTLSLRKCSYVCIHFKGILGFRHCLFWRNESAEDDMSWQPFPFFVMWPKEYFPGLFSPFKISYGWKQMCLVWMMTNFKLRNAFNRCYASLPLPIWSFLSPMKSAIKKSWFRRYFIPLTKIWGVTRLSQKRMAFWDRPFNLKEEGGGGVMVFCFVQN